MIEVKIIRNADKLNFISEQNLKLKVFKKNKFNYKELIGEFSFINNFTYTPLNNGLYTFEISNDCVECSNVTYDYYINTDLRESFLDTIENMICNNHESVCKEKENIDIINLVKSLSFYYLQNPNLFLYQQSAFICISDIISNINSCILLDEKILGKTKNTELLELILSFHYYVIYRYELDTNVDTDWVKNTYRENSILCCLNNTELPLDCIISNLDMFSKHTTLNELERDIILENKDSIDINTNNEDNTITLGVNENWLQTKLKPLSDLINILETKVSSLLNNKDITNNLICYDINKKGFLLKSYDVDNNELENLRVFKDINNNNIPEPLDWNYGRCEDVENTLFTNVQLSQSFQKNNCSPTEIGSTINYTVAAGTYSSTISQADANQKATDDIQANGQAFANQNGTCTPEITNTLPTVSGIVFEDGDCCDNTVEENQAPTVNAGEDTNVSENNVTLTAIGSDADGTIQSYLWEYIGGNDTGSTSSSTNPNIEIENPNSATTNISGLPEGTHTFRCTVTDNNGATAFDEVTVTYTIAVQSNTFFSVRAVGDDFLLESSQFINTADFTLNFENIEYDSASGDSTITSENISVAGTFDLSSVSSQNAFASAIVNQNSNVLSSGPWTLSGGVYSVTFEALSTSAGNPPNEGSSEYSLDTVTNVSAT